MFSKYFKAKLRAGAQKIKHNQKTGDVMLCGMLLQYEFTEELAQGIGPRAQAIQEMLACSNSAAAIKMNTTGLSLDTKHVTVSFKSGNKKIHEIKVTEGIAIRAKKPNAEDPNPVLEVTVTCSLEADHVDFIWQHLGEAIGVRMDKRQLEIPGSQGEETAE
jgi:hypothetical protein